MTDKKEEKGLLTLSCSLKKSIVVQIGEGIKIFARKERGRVHLTIEAPKDVKLTRLKEIEQHIKIDD